VPFFAVIFLGKDDKNGYTVMKKKCVYIMMFNDVE
jgi:hypothetical protein